MNRGCIPTKMLVHAADTVSSITDPSVRHRRDARRRALARHPRPRLRPDRPDRRRAGAVPPRSDRRTSPFYGGHGRFVGERQIEVTTPDGTSEIEGRQVVVSAGARPMIPDIPGLVDAGFYTSDDIMRVDRVPTTSSCSAAASSPVSSPTCSGRSARRSRSSSAARRCSRPRTTTSPRRSPRCSPALRRPHRSAHRAGRAARRRGHGASCRRHGITGSDLLVATGRIPNSDQIDAAAGGLGCIRTAGSSSTTPTHIGPRRLGTRRHQLAVHAQARRQPRGEDRQPQPRCTPTTLRTTNHRRSRMRCSPVRRSPASG